MNVLITGINGFIGRHLAKKLIYEGYNVLGVDVGPYCIVSSSIRYSSGSVMDKVLIRELVSESDIVFHLAAITAHSDIVENKLLSLKTNFDSTLLLLDAINWAGRDIKLIYCSTGKVYGDVKELPFTEDASPKPINILGKSKYMTEQLIDFNSSENCNNIVFRLFQVYGKGQSNNFLIPTILSQINVNERNNKIVLGDITARRDYIYIDDVVMAFVKAIGHIPKHSYSVFNICSGVSHSASDIVEIIGRLLNTNIKTDVDASCFRHDEIHDEYGDFSLAQKHLGWSPQYTIEQGLSAFITGK